MHTLICGVVESGKTTLAHKLAQFDEQDKKQIVVFDPVMTETAAGEWPGNAAIFTDEAKFCNYIVKQTGHESAIYIDESGDVFSHGQVENRWILTRGRHLGYAVTLICQRPKLVSPSVRHQCSRAFLFRLSNSDMREVTADYGFSNLGKVKLDKGDFLALHSGHAQVGRANIFLLVNKPRGAAEWNTTLNPPLQPLSLSRSSGASTRSVKPSPGSPKLSSVARAPDINRKD